MEGPRIPEGVDRPVISRRFRILREDVEKYDPTPGCPRCHNALVGKPAVNHWEECRDRMAQKMMEDESSRNHGKIMCEAERLAGQECEKLGRSEASGAQIEEKRRSDRRIR